MDRVRLLQLRDELQQELVEHEETGKLLRSGLTAIEKLLERSGPTATVAKAESQVVRTRRHRPVEAGEQTPRGSQAVEAILSETTEWMTVHELTRLQLERGWIPDSKDPQSAVRAAANRLARDKPESFERDHGRYRYRGELAQQPSLNGDGSTEWKGVDDPSMTAVSAFTGGDLQPDTSATTL